MTAARKHLRCCECRRIVLDPRYQDFDRRRKVWPLCRECLENQVRRETREQWRESAARSDV